MIPPMVMSVRIRSRGQRGFGIWLPLFLLWIAVVLLALPLLVLAVFADLILALAGSRISVTGAMLTLWRVVCELRGLRVEVSSPKGGTEVKVVCE